MLLCYYYWCQSKDVPKSVCLFFHVGNWWGRWTSLPGEFDALTPAHVHPLWTSDVRTSAARSCAGPEDPTVGRSWEPSTSDESLDVASGLGEGVASPANGAHDEGLGEGLWRKRQGVGQRQEQVKTSGDVLLFEVFIFCGRQS